MSLVWPPLVKKTTVSSVVWYTVFMIIAVDTGGTKTLIASFGKDGKIDKQIKFPTPSEPSHYVAQLISTLETNFKGTNVDAIVVGLPGIVKNGIAVWCNNLKWKNFDVATALHGVLGGAPILVENDANLAGLAETRQLKHVPELSLYVTISTGIGSGITSDGVINHSLRYSEAGRIQLGFDGAVREWETFASGKAIKRVYGKYAADIKSKRTWKQIADRISRGFLVIIPILQPTVIIIGGSIGTYYEQYGAALNAILKEKLPDHIPLPKIVQASHPELAVIYGCYYYAVDQLAAT
jgi:predicted NBD/HSP70 family sugar kinase